MNQICFRNKLSTIENVKTYENKFVFVCWAGQHRVETQLRAEVQQGKQINSETGDLPGKEGQTREEGEPRDEGEPREEALQDHCQDHQFTQKFLCTPGLAKAALSG